MSEGTSEDVRSRVVRSVLAATILLEGLLCVGYGVFLAVETVVGSAQDRLAAVVMAATSSLVGAALVAGAKAALQGRRGVRSPIVVWQLMQLSVAYLTWGTSWVALGLALGLMAVIAIGTSVWPGTFEEPAPTS